MFCKKRKIQIEVPEETTNDSIDGKIARAKHLRMVQDPTLEAETSLLKKLKVQRKKIQEPIQVENISNNPTLMNCHPMPAKPSRMVINLPIPADETSLLKKLKIQRKKIEEQDHGEDISNNPTPVKNMQEDIDNVDDKTVKEESIKNRITTFGGLLTLPMPNTTKSGQENIFKNQSWKT